MINIDTSLLIGIIGAAIGFIALKSRSNANSKLRDYERRVNAINEREEIKRETESLDDDALLDRFDWMRKQRENRKGVRK